jgi:hypothetical protein
MYRGGAEMTFAIFLGMASSVLNIPLVKHALLALAEKWDTPVLWGTQLDDWVVKIIYLATSLPEAEQAPAMEKALANVQGVYNLTKAGADVTVNGENIQFSDLKRTVEIDRSPSGAALPLWMSSEIGAC